MSYLPLDQMAFKDGPGIDATNRLRVSDASSIAGHTQEYNAQLLVWDNYSVSGGSATYDINRNATVLSTAGSTSGARALRQTKAYYRYIPGKSFLVKATGVLQAGSAPSGTARASLGYYDDNNGLFFYQNSSGVGVGKRSDTSGAVVETLAAQASWNLDKMDGTGSSGITLDPTKEQIFIIDFLWLGAGRVRFGFQIDGITYYVHEMMHANIITTTFIRTACLPPRYEVFNSGGTGSNISVLAQCCSIDSEGGQEDEPNFYPFAYSAYVASGMALDTTMRPVVSRRLRDTFNGKTVRGHAHSNNIELLVGTNDIYWEVRYNTTIVLGGGGSIVTANVDVTNSISEFDTYVGAANTVTGGTIISAGYSTAGSGSTRVLTAAVQGESAINLGRTYANIRDQYTLVARSISGAASLRFIANIREQY